MRTLTKLFQALDALGHSPSSQLLRQCDTAMVHALQSDPLADCAPLMLRLARFSYVPSEPLMELLLKPVVREDADLRAVATFLW